MSFITVIEKVIEIMVNIIEIKGSKIIHLGLKNKIVEVMTTPTDYTISPNI